MVLNEADLVIACFTVCAISVLWLLAFLRRDARQDRIYEVAGLEHLDELRWNRWTASMGWAPVTCWQGCADLHRDDWWRVHLSATCWPGCADLHRVDWWMAYVSEDAEIRENFGARILQTPSLGLGRTHLQPSADEPVRFPSPSPHPSPTSGVPMTGTDLCPV